ncbi:MAG: flippase-like domain-containing protein [Pirellulales bacterium]|nr:flippase-like domain-containing protein [Pirellulales bacterium]
MNPQAHRRRLLVAAAKLALAGGILAALVYRLWGDEAFARLLAEPKRWGPLATAQACIVLAFSASFARWTLLVRALHLPFSLRDGFRLGSLGFLLNQISLGSVGGDLFKAMFVAREQPGRRTEAVATVIVDRVVGLYAMLLVASGAVLVARDVAAESPILLGLTRAVAASLAVGTVGLVFVMTPWAAGPGMRGLAGRLPLVGATLERLVDAVGVYRDRRAYLFGALGIACATHLLLVSAFWLICRGLPVAKPTAAEMLLVAPMSLVAGAIPLTPSGLGTFETAFSQLFAIVAGSPGEGFMVAVTYRAMTYGMAAVGAAYYLAARRRVDAMLHEAEELADEIGAAGN